MKKKYLVSATLLVASLSQAFDFGAALGAASQVLQENSTKSAKTTQATKKTTVSSLSNSTVASGLKEALSSGVSFAVKELSKNGGYLNNSAVKIPLPDNLAKAESLIRKAGGAKMADNLILSMNNAAVKAAPKTAVIFADAIKNMSLDDAKKILAGGDNAATDYFKSTSNDSLKNAIKPIVQESMKDNNVASYYDTVNDFYKNNVKGMVESSGVMSMAKNFGADEYIPSASDTNIDDYVTQKALDGLFTMIASKETQIRENPVAQTSSLLKQVFGK
jgi:hypothetical protein